MISDCLSLFFMKYVSAVDDGRVSRGIGDTGLFVAGGLRVMCFVPCGLFVGFSFLSDHGFGVVMDSISPDGRQVALTLVQAGVVYQSYNPTCWELQRFWCTAGI